MTNFSIEHSFMNLATGAELWLEDVPTQKERFGPRNSKVVARRVSRDLYNPDCHVRATEVFGRWGGYMVLSELGVDYPVPGGGPSSRSTSLLWNVDRGPLIKSHFLPNPYHKYQLIELDAVTREKIYRQLAEPLNRIVGF